MIDLEEFILWAVKKYRMKILEDLIFDLAPHCFNIPPNFIDAITTKILFSMYYITHVYNKYYFEKLSKDILALLYI